MYRFVRRIFPAASVCIVGLAVATFAAADDRLAESAGEIRFASLGEYLADAPTPDPAEEPLFDGDVCGGGVCGEDCCDPVHPYRIRGAMSYFTVPNVETKIGGTYGIDTVYATTDRCGLYGAGKLNHFQGGTQVLASGGWYRMSDRAGCGILDRVGYSAIVDYFDDSRQNNLDFGVLRLQAGIPVGCDWALGVSYVKPFYERPTQLLFLPGGGVLQPTDHLSGFASGYVGDHLIYTAAGYRDSSSTFVFDASIRRPCRGNMFTFVDAHYEGRGKWVTLVGLEYRFGAAGCSSGCWSRNECSPWDDPTVAQSFNSGEAMTWGHHLEPGAPLVEPE